jgi:hypothetical protein
MPSPLYQLLTDCIYELDQVKARLQAIAEMLLEARGHGSGLDMRDDKQRREEYGDSPE